MNTTKNDIENELCIIGNILWEESSTDNFEETRYAKYVEHIKKCPVCKKRLEISEHDMEFLEI